MTTVFERPGFQLGVWISCVLILIVGLETPHVPAPLMIGAGIGFVLGILSLVDSGSRGRR